MISVLMHFNMSERISASKSVRSSLNPGRLITTSTGLASDQCIICLIPGHRAQANQEFKISGRRIPQPIKVFPFAS